MTKSGGNQFHGNANWLWNGSRFNANDWFNNQQGTERPHAVSNQWATSFSGPIKKNKLFFLTDYEGLRYVLPSGGAIFIPTSAFATATLNHLAATNPSAVPFYTTLFNLYGGASGAGRATPVTKAATDSALGCGTLAGTIGAFGVTQPCASQFQSTVNNLNTEWLMSDRLYRLESQQHRSHVLPVLDRSRRAGDRYGRHQPRFQREQRAAQSYTGQIGYTKTFSATAVNDLRLSGLYYTARIPVRRISPRHTCATFPTTFGFTDGLFSMLGGGANPSDTGDNNYPSGRNVQQWQIVDDYAWTHGRRHEFKFGVNLRSDRVGDSSYGPGTSGLMTFNSMTDFYNATLTQGSTYAQTFPRIPARRRSEFSSCSASMRRIRGRVTPRLTLTGAIRVEIYDRSVVRAQLLRRALVNLRSAQPQRHDPV